jgi:hypothetical protein
MRATLRIAIGLAICCPAAAWAQTPAAPAPSAAATLPTSPSAWPPAGYSRWQEFVDDSVRSPLWWVEVAGAGIIDHKSNVPDGWSGGSGYARRNVADAAKLLSAEGIGHALAGAMNQRVQYDRCTCTGIARAGHAFERAFVSLRADGQSTANIPLWMAMVGSAALASAWYPPSYTAHDVAIGSLTGLGAAAGIKALKEFTPELKHFFHVS